MTSAHEFPIEPDSPVGPGDLVAGKYRIEHVIGRGGMGVVVAARHEELDQRVALKFVVASAAFDESASARFDHEARAAFRFKTEHVAKVLDVGRLDSGARYIVMEYLEGADLGSVLQAQGPLPVSTAVDYLLQACEAIAEAHSLGIIHRDLKPQNLFLTTRVDGSAFVKVLDFGVSKTLATKRGEDNHDLTRTNAIVGSPLYMAPEQMRSSKSVDHRSDIWALGVVLYELLAGRRPFTGESIPEICLKSVSDPHDPIGRSDVPEALEAIVARCLAKAPVDRFGSVGELAIALRSHAPAGARSALSAPPFRAEVRDSVAEARLANTEPASTPPAPMLQTPAAWVQKSNGPGPQSRRGRHLAILGALVAIILGVGFAFGLARRGPARANTQAGSVPAASLEAKAPLSSAASSPAGTHETPIPAAPSPTGAELAPAPSEIRIPPALPEKGSSAPKSSPTRSKPRAHPAAGDDDIPSVR